MKKTLLCGAAIAALVLGFTACNDAYDLTATETVTENPAALPGPGNLVAHPTDAEWDNGGRDTYAGVVYLTWEPVIDAKGYDVYRKDLSDPNAVPVLISGNAPGGGPALSGTQHSYADVVSAGNVLKNWEDTDAARENRYTYTVVAVSNTSTAARGVNVVQNGRSEVTVRPYIPATYTASPIAAANLAITSITDQNTVRVSWTPLKNPALKYFVSWNAYAANTSGSLVSSYFTSKSWYETYHDIPISSANAGVINVSVITQFGDGIYYKSSAAVAKSAEFKFDSTANWSDPIGNLVAIDVSNSSVRIEWDAEVGDTTYKLERAEKDKDGNIIGTYTDKTNLIQSRGDTSSTTVGVAERVYTATDSTVTARKQYVYRVTATKNGIQRTKTVDSTGVFTYTSATVSLSIRRDFTTTTSNGIITYHWFTNVSIDSAVLVGSESVKIYRAPVTYIGGGSGSDYTFTETGPYTVVNPGTTDLDDSPYSYDRLNINYVYKAYIVRDGKELPNSNNPVNNTPRGSNYVSGTGSTHYLHP
jgi:hypothetical protein